VSAVSNKSQLYSAEIHQLLVQLIFVASARLVLLCCGMPGLVYSVIHTQKSLTSDSCGKCFCLVDGVHLMCVHGFMAGSVSSVIV